jgi:hypothetical protein
MIAPARAMPAADEAAGPQAMQERGGGDVVDLPGAAGLARVTDAAGDRGGGEGGFALSSISKVRIVKSRGRHRRDTRAVPDRA